MDGSRVHAALSAKVLFAREFLAQSLSQQRLDDGLAADVQACRARVKLPQHPFREVNVYAPYWPDDSKSIREEKRNIFSS